MTARRLSGIKIFDVRTAGPALVLAVVVPLVASGCGAGPGNETARESATQQVADVSAGSILIRGAEIVSTQSLETTPTPSTSPSPAPSNSPAASPAVAATPVTTPASGKKHHPSTSPSTSVSASPSAPPTDGYLMLSLINEGSHPDTLTNATIADGSVQPGAGTTSLTLKPRQTLTFSAPVIDPSGPSLDIVGASSPLLPGTSVKVTLSFQNNGTVSFDAPVTDPSAVGTTSTAEPLVITGTYPTVSPTPARGYPTSTAVPTSIPEG